MELTKIKIKNYKSIKNVDFDIEKRGDSYTTVLLGKNETGKSNILEAMSFLRPDRKKNYLDIVSRNNSNESDKISLFFTMKCDLDEKEEFRSMLESENIVLSEEIVSNIHVSDIVKEVYLEKKKKIFSKRWTFDFNKILLKDFLYREANQEVEKTDQEEENQEVEETNQEAVETSQESVRIVSKRDIGEAELEQYQELTHEKLQEILQPILEGFFSKHEPQVSSWKSEDSHLINGEISLKDFLSLPRNYPALLNMFRLCGFDTFEKIKNEMDDAAENSSCLHGLEQKLGKKTTEYINKKWKEHEVSIKVVIMKRPTFSEEKTMSEDMFIEVKVQDTENEDGFYEMSERSQGFKQFISLILSLSIPNHKGKIKNNLILIDEPETHLHPSGVRYMMKELLEIGKNNYLFIATHSPFMTDRDNPKRHFVLEKKYGKETKVKQIEDHQDTKDDEVLQQAFGINVIRDLISQRKILVEGASDKVLIGKVLKRIDSKSEILITNGHGDNLPAIASRLAFEKIYPLVITDDDRNGRRMVSETRKIKGDFTADNVRTIRGFNGNIKEGGTIEDTLPKAYVLSRTNEVLKSKNITEMKDGDLDEGKPFIRQIKEFISKNMPENGKKGSNKKEISPIENEIKTQISEDYDSEKIGSEPQLLYDLGTKILDFFKKEDIEKQKIVKDIHKQV